MNIELSIDCENEFTAGELCYQAGQALMEIMAFKKIPDLISEREEYEGLQEVESEFLCGSQCPSLWIRFRGLEERIQILWHETFDDAGEQGKWKGIIKAVGSQDRWGDALQFILASSTAVGLARLQNSIIRDQRAFFRETPEFEPGELVETVRRHALFGQVQDAARNLFTQVLLPSFAPEALQAIQIEKKMDRLMIDMLGLVKVSGQVDTNLFQKFYSLLEQSLAGMEMDFEKKKNVAGLLLLIEEYLKEESKKSDHPEKLLEEAQKVVGEIKKLGPIFSHIAQP